MKLWIDYTTFGYCMNRNGAYVFTLYNIKVFREKYNYYFTRDWKPNIILFTSGIDGYIFVLFMYVIV